MSEFTPEQIARLAEYYHERECAMNHTDGCGWFWEKGANYPPDRRWAHERWEKQVPALVERDRKNAAEVELILGSLAKVERLRAAGDALAVRYRKTFGLDGMFDAELRQWEAARRG